MKILKKKIRKFEKKIFTQNPKTLFKTNINQKKYKIIELKKYRLKQYDFGNKNMNKIFYVIKRSPGAGIFSNLIFVLNHLKIAQENNFIPFVDMENNPTIYSEINQIYKTNNSWEYFFKNLSEFTADEIYKSKNVIITDNEFIKSFEKWMSQDQEIVAILNKKIRFNDNINKLFKRLKKKYFENYKILGIHFRGTSYKTSPGHPLPATKKQMFNFVNYILKNNKVDKIFLSTEEKNYLSFFLKEFPGKIIYLPSAYRSDKNDAFDVYPRNNHRFKLGREILLESLLLSCSDYFLYTKSNVSEFALSIKMNKKQVKYKIDNGTNSLSKFKSTWIWYLKSYLPQSFGGFKNLDI